MPTTPTPDPAPDGSTGLDPQDWDALRALAHRMVDDSLDHLAGRRDEPVWRPMPDDVRGFFDTPLPHAPEGATAAYDDFLQHVVPYSMGNDHPRFWGWYMGAGNPVGNLADLLASVINPNMGGADHAPMLVEKQVVRWCAEAAGYPATASGLLVTGASEANLVGLAVARSARIGPTLRTDGMPDGRRFARLRLHRGAQLPPQGGRAAGPRESSLRKVPVRDDWTMDVDALAAAIAADRSAGVEPLAVVASRAPSTPAPSTTSRPSPTSPRPKGCGSTSTGPSAASSRSARTRMPCAGSSAPTRSRSTSTSGCRRRSTSGSPWCATRRRTGRRSPSSRSTSPTPRGGLAAGDVWFNEYGIALSRGFRALRVWMALKAYGADAFGRIMDGNMALAHALADRVDAHPDLERLAPVGCDIVCLRYAPDGGPGDRLDEVNHELVLRVQESGVAVVTDTVLDGRVAIRVAIGNHRTRDEDLELFLDTLVELGAATVADLEAGADLTSTPGTAPPDRSGVGAGRHPVRSAQARARASAASNHGSLASA